MDVRSDLGPCGVSPLCAVMSGGCLPRHVVWSVYVYGVSESQRRAAEIANVFDDFCAVVGWSQTFI
jgi:hypothetical protein